MSFYLIWIFFSTKQIKIPKETQAILSFISVAMIGSHLFGIALSFVLFRLFDIWKPSVIGRIDREVKGGWGVMGDDLLAGFFAGLLGLMIIGGIQRIESLAFLLEF